MVSENQYIEVRGAMPKRVTWARVNIVAWMSITTPLPRVIRNRKAPTIEGPYAVHPDTHVLTARARPDCVLQRAGHASLVETQGGETYMVYLCGRPLPNRGRCVLGRETAIQRMAFRYPLGR